MRVWAIEHEQTDAVAVMGTVIKSERTRNHSCPKLDILKLYICERMNPFEHKSTRPISIGIELGFQ